VYLNRGDTVKLSKRLQIISAAVERAEKNADADDVAYLIRHLAFEAALLVRSGRFRNEDQKVRIERAFDRAASIVKDIT